MQYKIIYQDNIIESLYNIHQQKLGWFLTCPSIVAVAATPLALQLLPFTFTSNTFLL